MDGSLMLWWLDRERNNQEIQETRFQPPHGNATEFLFNFAQNTLNFPLKLKPGCKIITLMKQNVCSSRE